jgi:hypothetical protein
MDKSNSRGRNGGSGKGNKHDRKKQVGIKVYHCLLL